ncbi:MAG: transposase [Chitinophagaceae bacterium]|nr:transposase [Chitinophagaceae bacterium]
MINNTALHTPKPDKDITQTKRKRHKRRAAIEPVIGHLKHDYRMSRNYLKGTVGDAINVILAAAAMNFKRMMNKWKVEFIFWPLKLFRFVNFYTQLIFVPKVKMTF